MQFVDNYYHALDKYGELPSITATPRTDIPKELEEFKTSLGPENLGTSLNPFQHQLHALNARIREGIGKIEFEFFGAQKGNKERPTPESFGKLEREDMKALADLNKIKTSVHASVAVQGLSGLGREGFDDQQRAEGLKEIKKAIDFAADVTQGGAIVVHTGEWQRPISESAWNKEVGEGQKQFMGYPEEGKKATLYVVDDRTGRFVGTISKDQELFEPVYWTAKDRAKEFGFQQTSDGMFIDKDGKTMHGDDWIDVHGKFIDPRNPESLFQRVPEWDQKKTQFKVQPVKWEDLVNKTTRFNEKYSTEYKPEQFFVRNHFENQMLQAKGSSLFHGLNYDEFKKTFDAAKQALEFAKKIEESYSTKEEQWKIMEQEGFNRYPIINKYVPAENKLPSQWLKEIMKDMENHMRYTHEASAAADVQARIHQAMLEHAKPVEEVGIKKTADTVAEAAIFAMQKTEQKHLKDPLYVAPENVFTAQYGSHPAELRKIIDESRKAFVTKMAVRYGEEEAKKLAEKHIKATLDVGHMNMWRQHFQKAYPNESIESQDKRFNEWLLKETEKLVKDKIVGHIHVSDNMGYDDEHLTPGQGNVPVKAFMKRLEDQGMKDFIIEVGSFNPITSVPDTFSYFGSPIYTAARPATTFAQIQGAHFGYGAPPNYIVGAYSPSNEWKLWSEVPFE
ncbi:MAG: TIM barrel protein [Nanoarchaeota archaeon]